jgi:hypothetical protein
MQYQLVLQFPGQDVEDFEDLIHLEDILITSLGANHVVDGHDFGARAMNIFILTDDPENAFEKAKNTLHHSLLDTMKAAYRKATGNDYIVIWPQGFSGTFSVL